MNIIYLLICLSSVSAFNDFPALMTANASMAVIVMKNLFKDHEIYENTLKNIFQFISNITKKEMHFSGIAINVFHDLNADLRRAACHESWELFKTAKKENLVHLAVTGPDCPRFPKNEGISVPLIEIGNELPQVFLDLRSSGAFSWKQMNILHDDTFDRDLISRVLKALSSELPNQRIKFASRTLFSIREAGSHLSNKQQLNAVLENLRSQQLGNRYLAIIGIDMVEIVMEVARSLKMTGPRSQWLYVFSVSAKKNNKDVTSFADQVTEGENVAFIYNSTKIVDACNSGLLCHIRELIVPLARALENSLINELELYKNVTDEEFEAVRLTKNGRKRELLDHMDREFQQKTGQNRKRNCGDCISWRITSAVTWGMSFNDYNENENNNNINNNNNNINNSNININNVNNNNSTKNGKLLETGVWTPRSGANLGDEIFPHISHGFRGKTLPIATYHNPPWQVIDVKEGDEVEYGGLVFDILKYISRKLNFTYTILSPGVKRNLNDTRQWSTLEKKLSKLPLSASKKIPEEIIEAVRTKQVLMAACAYTVNEYRKTVINFTLPVSTQTYSLLASRPKQLSRALLFTNPFANQTWACMAAAIIIMGPILYLIQKHSPAPKTGGNIKHVQLDSPWRCIWYVYGALLQQGGTHLPESDSARLIIGIWWLIVMVLVATYSGSLVAFLTFPKYDESIGSLSDLLDRENQVTWGFPRDSFLQQLLENSDNDRYRKLLRYSEKHNDTNDEQLLSRVKEGKHVLIDWRSSLKFVMRNDYLSFQKCHFYLGSEEFLSEPIAMIVSHDSPYLGLINNELKRMVETGLIEKWTAEKMPMKDKCGDGTEGNQEAINHEVDLADMQGIFFVLFLGFALSSLLLLCEIYWHRKKKARERKLIRPFVS